MVTTRASNASTDRQKWQKVFNAVVQMLQRQQTQIESLAKERMILEDRIKLQYDRCLSDVELLRGRLSQITWDSAVQEMIRNVKAAKAELMVGLKQKEASIYKIKLDNALDELTDFRVCFNYLSRQCCDTEEINPEVSALLSERDFVWNQYKNMESNLTDRLRNRSIEIEQANVKIEKLLTSMEQLQSLNGEKDNLILKLKTDVAKLETDSIKKGEDVSRLSRELESLRKGRSNSVTPVLWHCSVGPRISALGSKNSVPKKESQASHISNTGGRNSKRKSAEISDTPRLFTSTFKVPKLKTLSHAI